jgi:hypothetical protein
VKLPIPRVEIKCVLCHGSKVRFDKEAMLCGRPDPPCERCEGTGLETIRISWNAKGDER